MHSSVAPLAQSNFRIDDSVQDTRLADSDDEDASAVSKAPDPGNDGKLVTMTAKVTVEEILDELLDSEGVLASDYLASATIPKLKEESP